MALLHRLLGFLKRTCKPKYRSKYRSKRRSKSKDDASIYPMF
ncbi:hypothetical protein SAMN04487983_1002311 [Streptomyces sp. yr375]|nr:hypothetical protein [Streptomyces sp. yr375]SEP97498.1 hypothetical protein SAMN04487983_1002311 [Streptomyces sp. yr375]